MVNFLLWLSSEIEKNIKDTHFEPVYKTPNLLPLLLLTKMLAKLMFISKLLKLEKKIRQTMKQFLMEARNNLHENVLLHKF